jgi:tyrosyl-tRNA synthetase
MSKQNELTDLLRGVEEVIPSEEFKEKILSGEKLNIKFGADPTAPDIHLGHTVVLRKLRKFQEYGHKVTFIIGDFTAQIGDPSGRSKTRPPLTKEQVKINSETYKQQISKILLKENLEIVYNSDWLEPMKFNDVIKLASKYTLARMLERDDFNNRYKNNITISLHELLYCLMQGWDSVVLNSELEIGGTDQKFNLMVGRELQKVENKPQQLVMTMPILEGLDGKLKMSKSYNNYIALNDTPQDMFGKIMSVSDDLMFRYYELLTDVPLEIITEYKEGIASGKYHPKNIKKELGKVIVKFYYDEDSANIAEEEFEKVFKDKGLPEDIKTVKVEEKSISVVDLIERTELLSSRGEIKRMLKQNAVSINDNKVSDINMIVEITNEMIIKIGKRKFAKIIT